MEEIIEKLLKSNLIKISESIDYDKFLEIYQPYEAVMSEIHFAEMLEISERRYKSIRNERGKRARVLSNRGKAEQDVIKLEMKKKIEYSKYIDYKEFLELYEEYKSRISEIEFAQILGMSYGGYERIKNLETARAKIMAGKGKIIGKDKKCIQDEVLKEIEAGQSVDYKEFLRLYNPYRELVKEIEFAEIIGITYNSYYSIKTKNKRAKVLKERKPEEIKRIKEKIDRDLISGEPINYYQFLEMYEPYKEKLTEEEFAKVLGIRYANYTTMKYNRNRARIQKKQSEIERIKYELKESRYYSKDELEEVAKKYNVEVDELIAHLCCKNRRKNLCEYKELLDEKGKIWIGKTKCTKKFAENHAKAILKYAHKFSKILCKDYHISTKVEDFAMQTVIYILEKRGDIEKNYGDDFEKAERIIKRQIFMSIKIRCICEIKKVKRTISIYKDAASKDGKKGDPILNLKGKYAEHDEENDVQKQVEDIILDEEKKQTKQPEELCVEALKIYIDNGFSREEAIAKTSEKLGMDPEEMLDALKTYLIKNKKVRKTQNEEYILGD